MARLVGVSTRIEGRATAVVIETSEPVAYATAQPDPLTVLVDLRNVTTGPASPIEKQKGIVSDLSVEAAKADDGTSLARVRLTLAKPGKPTVRSRWNTVIVEFGTRLDDASLAASGVAPRSASPVAPGPSSMSAPAPQTAVRPPVKTPAQPGAPIVQKPAASTSSDPVGTLTGIETTTGPDGTRVRFTGTGRLRPTSVEPTKGLPARLVIDFAQVLTKLPAVTAVGKGPIDRIRVAINSRQPLVTRAVIDLKYPVAHRVEATDSGVTILLDPTPAADAPASFAPPEAPATPAQVPTPTVVPPPVPAAQPEVRPSPPAAPAPTAPAPAPIQVAPVDQFGQTARKFTGHLISMNFQQADLRAVLRGFTEISGLNVIVDSSINGTVDVVLNEVPWDQALEYILSANKLGYVVQNNVVRIAPLATLADEEAARQKLKDAQAMSGTLKVLTKTLSYAKADDLAALLLKSALTPRGQVTVDKRTNTLIISDLPAAVAVAEDLIATLDRAEPQVEIEAKIVQTTRDSARALGVQWGLNGRMASELANTSPLAFPAQGSISGRTGATQGNSAAAIQTQVPSGVNLPVAGATSAVGLAMGTLNGAFNLDLALSALVHSGTAKLLSQPRVTMQNNYQAEMTQGVEIPIQTVMNNTVTVTFKVAALTLKVKPQITAAGTVILDVNLENASPDFSRSVNGIPPIDTQRAISQVLVTDGETIVIGGIMNTTETQAREGVPGLSRLPLLGWLFKRDSVSDVGRELLIFITPRIKR